MSRKNIYNFATILVAISFLFIPNSIFAASPPKIDLLPGMSDTLFVDQGVMNEIKLFKVDDKFYFFNLGSQEGVLLDIYDSSMHLLKHVVIGEMTHQIVKIVYNEHTKQFGVFWNDFDNGDHFSIFYRFLDLEGNLLTDVARLGMTAKIDGVPAQQNSNPYIAYDEVGNYMIVWTSTQNYNPPYGGSCIFAQKINKNLTTDGEPISLSECSGKTSLMATGLVSAGGKYFTHWITLSGNIQSSDSLIANGYYKIFDSSTIQTALPVLISDSSLSDSLFPSETITDQNNAYIILEKAHKEDVYNRSYLLVKFDMNTKSFSKPYSINDNCYSYADHIVKNGKLYFNCTWYNGNFSDSILRNFLDVVDLQNNQTNEINLMENYGYSTFGLGLESIQDGNLYFYRFYRESTHSNPVYGYLTVLPESLIDKNNQNPLMRFINIKNPSSIVNSGNQSKTQASASSVMAKKQAGKILLQVESKGEAWYVDPTSLRRYYLKDGNTAYDALRKLGLGITNTNLAKIPVGIEDRVIGADSDGDKLDDKTEIALGTDPNEKDSDNDGYDDGAEVKGNYNPRGTGSMKTDNGFASKLEGKIILQVEGRGEAWYVYNGKRYYMANGSFAYQIMRFLSLGITNANLEKIEVGSL